MTTPNIEELIRLLHQIYQSDEIDYRAISQAADALQSQAERIKELETDNKSFDAANTEMIGDVNKLLLERDTLRAQLAQGLTMNERAQLAAIAATEPDIYVHQDGLQVWGAKNNAALGNNPNFTAYFTRPMPARDVTELVEALKGALYSLECFGVSCQKGVVAACRCRKCAIERGDAALSKYKGAK